MAIREPYGQLRCFPPRAQLEQLESGRLDGRGRPELRNPDRSAWIQLRKNMENDPLRSTGAIYNRDAPTRSDVAKGPWQWNTFLIEAVGGRIKVTLNGVLVNDFTDPKPRSLRGHIALQNHHDGSKVQFRNIRIKAVVPGVTDLPLPRVA